MIICLEQGANDLHIAHLLPLPPPSSLASLKSKLVLPFWWRLTQVVLEKRPWNGCLSYIINLFLLYQATWHYAVLVTFSFVRLMPESNVAMTAWLPQASYPCGNFLTPLALNSQRAKGSIGHAFTVRIRTENQNQVSFCPFAPREVSVLAELTLGHLRYLLTGFWFVLFETALLLLLHFTYKLQLLRNIFHVRVIFMLAVCLTCWRLHILLHWASCQCCRVTVNVAYFTVLMFIIFDSYLYYESSIFSSKH